MGKQSVMSSQVGNMKMYCLSFCFIVSDKKVLWESRVLLFDAMSIMCWEVPTMMSFYT